MIHHASLTWSLFVEGFPILNYHNTRLRSAEFSWRLEGSTTFDAKSLEMLPGEISDDWGFSTLRQRKHEVLNEVGCVVIAAESVRNHRSTCGGHEASNLKSFLWRDTFRDLLHSMEKKKGQESKECQNPRRCSFGHDRSYKKQFLPQWKRFFSWNMSSFQKGVMFPSRSSRTSTGLLGEFRIAALEVPTLRRLLSSSSSLIGKACHRHTIRHHMAS